MGLSALSAFLVFLMVLVALGDLAAAFLGAFLGVVFLGGMVFGKGLGEVLRLRVQAR